MSVIIPVVLPPTPPRQSASDLKKRLGDLRTDVITDSLFVVRQVHHVALARHCSFETLKELYEMMRHQLVLLGSLADTTHQHHSGL